MRYSNTYRDEHQRPLKGAKAYIYRDDGTLAIDMTADGGAALSNPIIADQFGVVTFNAAFITFTIDVIFGGRRVWREAVESQTGLAGPPGPAGPVGPSSTSTINSLVAASPADGDASIVTNSLRAGVFFYFAGNYTAQVASDPLNGIYVPLTSDPSGSGGCWVRQSPTGASAPEWWGAIPNDSTQDCGPAILAALAVHGNVELDSADYYINAMLVHDQAFTRLAGKGELSNGFVAQGTRLLVKDGTSTCVQVGPSTQPGTLAAFPQGIVFENIHCARTVAPVKGTTAASIRVQYTLNARLDRVRGAGSIYGIHVLGNVGLNMVDCYGARALIGSGVAADQFRGIYVDGSATLGLNGGNSYVWIRRANLSCSATIADSAGIYVDGKYTDCFISDPQTTGGSYGIWVVGLGATTTSTANRNLILIHPVCDAPTIAGIRISAVNRSGSVEITHPYCGPVTGATAAIQIDSCVGGVTINGGQLDLSAAAAVPGVLITSSNGIAVNGTTVHDCTVNAVSATGSNNLILRPNVENYAVTSTGAAVQLTSCTRAIAAPMVRGGTIAKGIELVGSANSKVDVNVTNIDNAAATTVVSVNAISITARGDYTSAGAVSGSGTVNVAGQL